MSSNHSSNLSFSQDIKFRPQKCFLPKEEKKYSPAIFPTKSNMPRERSVFVKKLYNEVHLPEKKKRRCDDGDDIFNNLNSDSDDDITDLLWRRK